MQNRKQLHLLYNAKSNIKEKRKSNEKNNINIILLAPKQQ